MQYIVSWSLNGETVYSEVSAKSNEDAFLKTLDKSFEEAPLDDRGNKQMGYVEVIGVATDRLRGELL